MQLIYINDKYSDKSNKFYAEYKVELPVLNRKYTIRRVDLNNAGEYVLLLNEIKNEHVWVDGKPMGEPGFHYSRFTDVPDNVLDWEKVHEIYKNQK